MDMDAENMPQVETKTMRLFERLVRGFEPPDDLTVSEWAEKYRRLSPESAAEPGGWRNSRTPYLCEIMDAFCDPRVRIITVVAASQVGKTEAEMNMIGYIIDNDPGSILFVHPTVVDAKDFSKLRIAPMIRDTPVLRRKVADPKQRDSRNTLLSKSYPGGILTLTGSTEAHALASKPIRYVIGDERDRWAGSAGTEGDPWELALKRQKTFYNAKAIEVSTPTVKGASPIAAGYARGTMERWVTACPHCGEYHEIRWKDIRFEYETKEIDKQKTYSVRDVFYFCPGCGAQSDELTMKRQPSRWEASNPDALREHGRRSFWLNAFVSAWSRWDDIIKDYLAASGDPRKMQVVMNTDLGELWEERDDAEDEEGVMGRREEYDAELPDGVLCLTCGIDTQDDRLEYEIVGHGHFRETWGIKRGILRGRPNDAETWQKLDDVLDHVYKFRDGIGMRVSMAFMDEGGHYTQEVRLGCRARQAKQLYAIQGMPGQNRPFVSPPKLQKIVIDGRHMGTVWVYQLGVDAGKAMIMDSLRVREPGERFCHFPRRDDYGTAYFTGLFSEKLVYDEKARQHWKWVKRPGRERNESLDCRNYAMAAKRALEPDLDAIDRRLKAARVGTKTGAQIPETVGIQTGKRQTPTNDAGRVRDKQRGMFDGAENSFDKW